MLLKHKVILVPLLGLVFSFGAISANAHTVIFCTTVWKYDGLDCVLVYDPFFEDWRIDCTARYVPVTECEVLPHIHDEETDEERDLRVMTTMADCILDKVFDAVASCTEDDDYSSDCMENTYANTFEYLGTLRQSLVPDGDMISKTPVYHPNGNGNEVYGVFDPDKNGGQIDINVDYHTRHHTSIDEREHELAMTIVHEKIHWHDWFGGEGDHDHDMTEDEVERDAKTVLEELFGTSDNPGSSCDVNWNKQEKVIYGSF